MYRRLYTSRLFEILGEAAIKHTELLGAGRSKTLDKGLLWVVTLQKAQISKMPMYDEEIIIETWPGQTMHVLFPRYFRILDANQNVLVSASSLWTLIDAKNRKVISPLDYEIKIDGIKTGNEIADPLPPAKLSSLYKEEFTVPFSYLDLNGHMNNARYFDLVENIIPEAKNGKQLKTVCTEYCYELCLDNKINVLWNKKDSYFYFTGVGDKTYFKMGLEYQKE